MTDFKPGIIAPDFSLPGFKLSEALKKGALLLTFYKKTCPTCQMTYPFFEKLHTHYSSPNFKMVGIGQDPETQEFSKTYGVTFQMVSDTSSYDISKKYHITIVPTAFFISPVGKIESLLIGFSKKELMGLSKKMSHQTKKPFLDLFKDVNVPEFKPG